MKLKTLLFLLLAMLTSTTLQAYDAEIGDINYNFISENEAEVTGEQEYSGDIVIPESVTWGGKTYSVTSIGEGAFWGCLELTSITIPNSVKVIKDSAIALCGSLSTINMGDGVITIGSWAFHDCGNLTSITLPNNLTSIGYGAFGGCWFRKDGFINNSPLTSDDNWGANFYETETDDGLLIDGSTVVKCRNWATTVTIPDNITTIGDGAFSDCSNLTDVIIPGSVGRIGNDAFFNCSSLTSINIPEGVTSIDYQAFSGCSLTSITIPESVEFIHGTALGGCMSLTTIIVEEGNLFYDSRDNCNAIIETESNTLITGCQNTIIPNSVECIGEWAFGACPNLTSITIPESVTSIGDYAIFWTGLTSVTIPESVTSIGAHAFDSSGELTSIVLPESLTSIRECIFLWCSGLTSISIPEGVTSIGEWAFRGCSSLTSISIPKSVTSIGEQAFAGCSGLRNIYCYAEEAPVAENEAFEEVNRRLCKLHVPPTSVEAYSTTEPWSNFKNIVSIEPYVLTYMIDGEEYASYQIEEGKPITAEPAPTKEGYTFSGWNDLP
ncbi:MAG: leucine-rich repeat protein, partial [Bacteroidaceae bacterium]|nr:leucine-rich repeat protein [Bacteroidaceae bacterium]